ncbi:protein PRY1-like isoform X2 [Dendronephthya gigantea]|uniref:protein PRY1-like isoform X2 n=1 Tax=Dendronephthya gigantea TaxID=151771 RepID=UPI00106D2D22|nr:protein PRY1-like isoform X2 [Dendronephthya gigantea]
MSWQSKAQQRQYKLVLNGKDLKKISTQSEIVWKDSKELGMAKATTPDGRYTYVVGRYRPAGNMMGNFEGNVFKSKSNDKPTFIKKAAEKASEEGGEEESSRVVERTWGNPGQQQTRVIVKETRTTTPSGGVKTVKSTTTWTTSSNVKQTNPTSDGMDDPSPRFKSLNISDHEKPAKRQEPASKKADQPAGVFQQQALSFHNQYRRLHQAPDLRWSNELARDAQAWAQKIASQNTLRHSTSQERKGDGENLAYFGGKFDEVGKDSVNMWYDEEKKYQYRNPGFKSGTGHFTQVVWKGSQELGMGWAKSADGRSAFIVARYRPAGNMQGSFDQNVSPPRK